MAGNEAININQKPLVGNEAININQQSLAWTNSRAFIGRIWSNVFKSIIQLTLVENEAMYSNQ